MTCFFAFRTCSNVGAGGKNGDGILRKIVELRLVGSQFALKVLGGEGGRGLIS